ncbi:dehydratase [Williamsia deligens]|nr:Acyl dehydratase [Williamsia deligens]
MTNASDTSINSVEDRLAIMASQNSLSPEEIAERTAAQVGFHYTVEDYYEVGREKVREYARAVQDGHPVHWNEAAANANGHPTLIAPLSFAAIPGMIAQRRLFEEMVEGWDLWKMMQTDQRLVFHKPVEVGDRLICVVSLDSYRQMGGADIMVTKNQIHNQHDVPVMTTWTTLVARAGEAPDPSFMTTVAHTMLVEGAFYDHGRTVADHSGFFTEPDPVVDPKPYGAISFDDVHVGQELEPRTVKLTRGNLINYAGVAGDPNPIHFSDEIAKIAGLDTAVAHGMQTMGIGGGYISAFVGDPGAVYEYNVRFTSPVYVPADGYGQIDLTAKVKSLDPETRRGQIAMTAKSNGKKIFGRAFANVQFA